MVAGWFCCRAPGMLCVAPCFDLDTSAGYYCCRFFAHRRCLCPCVPVAPLMEQLVSEPPPLVVLVHGPPGVRQGVLCAAVCKAAAMCACPRNLAGLLLQPSGIMACMQVGKSTLIRCLVKHYTTQNIGEIRGPITVVAGKSRRITFVECPPDLHGMLDAAKYADLALLLVRHVLCTY